MFVSQRVRQCSGAFIGLLSIAALAGATIAQTQGVKGVRDSQTKAAPQYPALPPNSILPIPEKGVIQAPPARQIRPENLQPSLGFAPTVRGAAEQIHPLVPNTDLTGASLREQLPQRSARQQQGLGNPATNLGPDQLPNNHQNAGAFCGGPCSDLQNQPPNQSNGYFSEASCNLCGQPQVLADDVSVGTAQDICDITVWGGYYPTNSTPADSFTLIVHADGGGVPGATIYTESGMAPSRFQTGVVLFGVNEWQYDFVPSGTVRLTPGTYWIEIYNDINTGDDWFWEVGNGSGFNAQVSFTAPGAAWSNVGVDLAMVVCGQDQVGGGFTCTDGGCAVQCQQDVNGANAWASGNNFPYSEAEDFFLSATKDICEVTFWGIYLNNTGPADNFTVLVHSDAGGFPGGVVYSESNIALSRFLTGNLLFGFYQEWQYQWVPASTLRLTAGTYWLEIENNLTTDFWYWETGNLGAGKYDGHYFAPETPGVNWSFVGDNLSLAVCGQDQVGGGFTCADDACDVQCEQDPNQLNGYFSDSDYGYNNAEDFALASTKDICEITFWGAYYPGDSAPADDFCINVHSDAGGFPGAVVYSECGAAPSRFQTGVTLFGVHEWQYSWTPASTLRLTAGVYWLEIYQNNALPDVWFWETGNLAAGKYDGHYNVFGEFPGVNWGFVGDNLALAVCGQDQSVQLCSGSCQPQLVQLPNQSNGIFSEDDCAFCGGGDQVLADDFVLGAEQDICDITVWGAYYPNNSAPNDSFTVNIHADAGGIPGAVVCSESGLQPSRFQTGVILFGVNEWQYDIVLSNTCRLAPGVYWVEVYNAVTGDDWFWEAGNSTNGVSAYAFEAPGVNWNLEGIDLAMVVCTQDQVVEGRECPRTCDMRAEQFADGVNGFFSDEFLDCCGGSQQAMSDNVVITSDVEICQIVVTGGYFPNNSQPADDFTVRILADTGAGIPDDATQLYCESPQFTYRIQTGNVVFGVDEWKHTLVATTPWVLSPGVYWIEVYNNVLGDDWFWETATLDANNGVSGCAFAFTTAGCNPGATAWNAFGGVELALQLCGKDPTTLGQNYCPIVDNSAPGAGASLSASGDSSVSSATPLTLTATDVPNQFGIFYHGENPNQIPFGNGFQCVTGGIVRGAVVHASGNTISYSYDESDAKHSLAAVQAISRRFQYWFRDPAAGGAFFNLSDAMCIFIRP